MERRAFLAGAAALLATPLAAEAQPAGGAHRIGFLGNTTPALEANLVGPFREGLRELGYVEGQNIVIEYRWAEGKYERFPALIAELLVQKVEVIVTAGTPASLAVQKATTSVPLVMVASVILSLPASSRASRGRAVTSPESRRIRKDWRGNGLSCSRKCCLRFRASPCFGIRRTRTR